MQRHGAGTAADVRQDLRAPVGSSAGGRFSVARALLAKLEQLGVPLGVWCEQRAAALNL